MPFLANIGCCLNFLDQALQIQEQVKMSLLTVHVQKALEGFVLTLNVNFTHTIIFLSVDFFTNSNLNF